MMRKIALILPLLGLTACGSTTTSRIVETTTLVPTTINGVAVTADTIADQPGVTVITGDGLTDAEVEERRLAEIVELDARLGLDTQEYTRINDAVVDANIFDKAGSRWTLIPTAGTMNYEGELTFLVDGPDEGQYYGTGIALLSANFDRPNQTVSAEVSNMFGRNPDEELIAYSGSITLENGRIGANVPNDIGFDVTGTLTTDGTTITMNGPFDGKFVGTPLAGVVIESGRGDPVDFTLNGADAPDGYLLLEAIPK